MGLSDIRGLSKDDLLDYLGLQTKYSLADWAWPALGIFAGGLIVGAGLGLMFAPKPGAEMRSGLADRICAMKEKRSERMSESPPH